MKVNVSQTRNIVLIRVLAFGLLQHAASAADERQTLQALGKSFPAAPNTTTFIRSVPLAILLDHT